METYCQNSATNKETFLKFSGAESLPVWLQISQGRAWSVAGSGEHASDVLCGFSGGWPHLTAGHSEILLQIHKRGLFVLNKQNYKNSFVYQKTLIPAFSARSFYYKRDFVKKYLQQNLKGYFVYIYKWDKFN